MRCLGLRRQMWALVKTGANPQSEGLETTKESQRNGLHIPKGPLVERDDFIRQITAWNEANFQSLHTLNLQHFN